MANRKDNNGGNSELDGKYWNCPTYVLNCLGNAVKKYETLNKGGEPTEGYQRALGILEDNRVEYKHMKRIKNWFDTWEGSHDDIEYELNGGKTMHNWVDGTLTRETEAIKAPKKIKSQTGMANQFIKNHEKDNNKVYKNSLKIRIPQPHKDIGGQITRGKPIYEQTERIKELIKYRHKK